MPKLFIKSIIGILFLSVLGMFIFQIYQQKQVLSEIYQWFSSGKYFFEGLSDERMHQQLKVQQLNNYMPRFDKIYKASLSAANFGLEKNESDTCQTYYHLVLEDIPQMQEAHVFLGFCEYKAGNVPGAFLEFKQGLASGAGVFWASYDLGILAMMSGNADVTEVLFIQAVKLPLADVMKNIMTSKLFQQYMQVNGITPQKLLDGIDQARQDALQDLRSIEEARRSNASISLKHELRLRIF